MITIDFIVSLHLIVLAFALSITFRIVSVAAFANKYPVKSVHYDLVEPVRMIALGDWGGKSRAPYTTPEQLAVARQMHLYAHANPINFVFSLGDNFYPNGIHATNVHRFKATFEDVYVGNNLTNVKWLVVAGNHDHRGDINKQLEYTNLSKVWHFPSLLHTVTINLKYPNGKGKSHSKDFKLVFIDTTVMCNLYDFNYFSQSRKKLNALYYNQLINELETSMVNVKNEQIILIGHHPFYTEMSIRKAGKCMQESLASLFLRYPISTYISGHDHVLQYIQYELKKNETHTKTVNLLVSGAGHGVYRLKPAKKRMKNVKAKFYWSGDKNRTKLNGGFLTLSLYKDSLNFTFVNASGFELFDDAILF
jgi:tartrate-resistant acid phosphatase type 5